MILDNETVLAEDLAHGSDSVVLDLEAVRPGPGEPIKLWIQGSADLAGATGFTVLDGATSSPADTLITHTCTLAGNLIEFELPSDTARYIKVSLTGSTSAGTWDCAVSLPGVQTNL